jgi:hypothetical protein
MMKSFLVDFPVPCLTTEELKQKVNMYLPPDMCMSVDMDGLLPSRDLNSGSNFVGRQWCRVFFWTPQEVSIN